MMLPGLLGLYPVNVPNVAPAPPLMVVDTPKFKLPSIAPLLLKIDRVPCDLMA